MLDKIINEAELDFLETVGIVVKGNKLIKKDTNEEYEFCGVNDDIEFVFQCNDSKVVFIAYENKDGEFVPVSVRLEENGLCYNASVYNGRELSINKIGENYYSISINPKVDKNFITTKIKYRVLNYSFTDEKKISCSFAKIFTYPNFSQDNDVCLFTYDYYVGSSIIDFYPEEIRDAFIICKPFIYNGFEEYLAYPLDHYDEFVKYFEDKKTDSELVYARCSAQAVEAKNSVISDGMYKLEKNNKQNDISETAGLYFKASERLNELATKAYNEKMEREKNIANEQEEFESYVHSYNEKHESLKS